MFTRATNFTLQTSRVALTSSGLSSVILNRAHIEFVDCKGSFRNLEASVVLILSLAFAILIQPFKDFVWQHSFFLLFKSFRANRIGTLRSTRKGVCLSAIRKISHQ